MSIADDATGDLPMTDPRDVRAMSELLAVYEQAPGLYSVYCEDGTEYTVDAETGACTVGDQPSRDDHPFRR